MAKATCDHCCCCIELRKGCLIYGYLEVIVFICFITQLFELWNDVGPLIALMNELSKTKISDEELEDLRKAIRAVFVGIIIVMLLLSALKIFFNIILLIGLHKNKRGHVGAYLIYTAIFFLLGSIFLIVGIANFANMDNTKIEMPDEFTAMVITQFIQIFLCHVIAVYFWMVIRSQYHLMPINRPKKFTNPIDAEASTPATRHVQSGGTTSQPSDDRGTHDASRYEHCASLIEAGSLTSQAEVRHEGLPTRLADEDTLTTNIAVSSNHCTASVDVSATSPASAVPPEQNQTEYVVPKSQNSNVGSQAENRADNTRQSTPPPDVAPSTSSATHVLAPLRRKTDSGEVCEIELVPICEKKLLSVEIEDFEKCKRV